jgi:hypothetical protein
VLLIANTGKITLLQPVLLIANTGKITLLRRGLLLSDIVLTTPLFAALKLAGRKAGDGTLNFTPSVSNGILIIPAKIVDEFGLSLLKLAFARNAVRMASYGMMPHVNWFSTRSHMSLRKASFPPILSSQAISTTTSYHWVLLELRMIRRHLDGTGL